MISNNFQFDVIMYWRMQAVSIAFCVLCTGQANGLTCVYTHGGRASSAREELAELWPTAMVVVVTQDTAARAKRCVHSGLRSEKGAIGALGNVIIVYECQRGKRGLIGVSNPGFKNKSRAPTRRISPPGGWAVSLELFWRVLVCSLYRYSSSPLQGEKE